MGKVFLLACYTNNYLSVISAGSEIAASKWCNPQTTTAMNQLVFFDTANTCYLDSPIPPKASILVCEIEAEGNQKLCASTSLYREKIKHHHCWFFLSFSRRMFGPCHRLCEHCGPILQTFSWDGEFLRSCGIVQVG